MNVDDARNASGDGMGAWPAVKILALVGLAVGAILSDRWWVLAALLAVPLLWWIGHRKGLLQLAAMLRRTWVFLAFLMLSFVLVPPEGADALTLEVAGRVIDLSGLPVGARMALRLLTIIVASLALRETGRPREMLIGLRQLRLPLPAAQTIDATLSLVAAQRAGRKRGRRRGRRTTRGERGAARGLRERGRAMAARLAASFHETMARSAEELGSAPEGTTRHVSLLPDVVIVTGLVVMVMGLKMVKVLPGIPFASGNKLMLIFPLYFAAARFTRSRVGATWMGTTLGVVSFLFGEGRFGILEIAKYVAAGLLLDLVWPLVRRRGGVIAYGATGLLMGLGWLASTLLAAWVARAPAIFYALLGAMAISQLAFSLLSGPVSWALLRALEKPAEPEPAAERAERPARVARPGTGGGGGGGAGGRRGADWPPQNDSDIK